MTWHLVESLTYFNWMLSDFFFSTSMSPQNSKGHGFLFGKRRQPTRRLATAVAFYYQEYADRFWSPFSGFHVTVVCQVDHRYELCIFWCDNFCLSGNHVHGTCRQPWVLGHLWKPCLDKLKLAVGASRLCRQKLVCIVEQSIHVYSAAKNWLY